VSSDIGRSIDAVVRDTVAPALEAAGFRKQARTFRRASGDAIHVVNVQGSTRNMGAEGRFTLILGIYFASVAALLTSPEAVSDAPAEMDCQLRQRIGPLMPGRQDHWWSIDATTDLAALGAEVVDAWHRHGAPWFDGLPDLVAAGARLEQQWSFHEAAAAALADGDRALAARRLADGLTRRPSFTVLRGWGKAHGLLGDAASG